MSLKQRLQQIEVKLNQAFPDLKIKVSWQTFAMHAEFWVYVLDMEKFEEVRKWCDAIEKQDLATLEPEIWMIPQLWTVPWPGSDPEADKRYVEKLETRREDFRRRHNLVRAGV